MSVELYLRMLAACFNYVSKKTKGERWLETQLCSYVFNSVDIRGVLWAFHSSKTEESLRGTVMQQHSQPSRECNISTSVEHYVIFQTLCHFRWSKLDHRQANHTVLFPHPSTAIMRCYESEAEMWQLRCAPYGIEEEKVRTSFFRLFMVLTDVRAAVHRSPDWVAVGSWRPEQWWVSWNMR